MKGKFQDAPVKVTKNQIKSNSDVYEIYLGTFIDNAFTWYSIKKFKDPTAAYKEFKNYVNTQLKYTDEELKQVWDTGRLDIELRQGNKLLNWVGIYSREVKPLTKKEEKEAEKGKVKKEKKDSIKDSKEWFKNFDFDMIEEQDYLDYHEGWSYRDEWESGYITGEIYLYGQVWNNDVYDEEGEKPFLEFEAYYEPSSRSDLSEDATCDCRKFIIAKEDSDKDLSYEEIAEFFKCSVDDAKQLVRTLEETLNERADELLYDKLGKEGAFYDPDNEYYDIDAR